MSAAHGQMFKAFILSFLMGAKKNSLLISMYSLVYVNLIHSLWITLNAISAKIDFFMHSHTRSRPTCRKRGKYQGKWNLLEVFFVMCYSFCNEEQFIHAWFFSRSVISLKYHQKMTVNVMLHVVSRECTITDLGRNLSVVEHLPLPSKMMIYDKKSKIWSFLLLTLYIPVNVCFLPLVTG